jgi:hypothetical protein
MISSPIYLSYSHLTIWKNPPNILAGIIFDLLNGTILLGIFIIIYEGIPGDGWKKGINYGLIIGLFRVVMMTFSVIAVYNIPLILILIGLITGYIEIIALGLITAIIYEKFKLG